MNDDGTPRLPLRADPRLFDAARRLGELTDFLVITSNGVHVFQSEIEQAAGRKVLSMVDATIGEVARRGWTRVGVLGLGDPVVYTQPLRGRGIACETIAGERRAALDGAIFRTMEGRDDAESTAAARSAVDELRARRVDGVIIGCTEIPLLLRDAMGAKDLINPAQLLAEAAVRAAMA